MQRDIESRRDIDALMVAFYGRAMSDPIIGHLFTEVAKLDLQHHLPVIGDFWESVLFGTGVYGRHGRHPLLVHAELDRLERLQPQHFERWLALFTGSVDEAFTGIYAESIKQRGHAIARRMQQFLAGE